MEFLNTEPEANNEFWLWLDDEDDRLYPEDIASPDIQKAVNVFCMDAFQFLRQLFPEYEDKLLIVLKQNQTISELLRFPIDNDQTFNEIVYLITDWFETVFQYQILNAVYSDDVSFSPDRATQQILNHPEVFNIPRREIAMNKLRELWKTFTPDFRIEVVRQKCQIDMSDWDMQQRRLLA